ncbi:divergent PAP2 family protein [Prochlorococcus marinus]|uniref:Divergent PAP2 family protein n=1 Tax=Prochlorococcus marinus XMU1408 TaxID=2213228 RepID=A0A318REA6_PROMR|nr:divergent PAP2 family protein [Prochlorococcus marinus]MBW3042287.1 divergent PAP2 family protein [Prochlorococcus marinus str. XMU1408]PYE01675.1 divergent PAP2 family protein [Prochlorococcus marinus XMU1408]
MNINPALENQFVFILDNAVLAWGLAACGLAQLSKLLFELIFKQRWRPSVLIETGGMPSSHSALVTGTAAGVGLQLGFDDPLFALASTIAFIVMYDASGIRRSAGLTAAKVNQISKINFNESSSETTLKESLGHTKIEVLVGSLLGPSVALPGILFIGSPLHLLQMIGLFSV